jgi:hypothetical protein
VSAGQGGTHVNSQDVYLNTSVSGLFCYVALDAALLGDLASGVSGGLRIAQAASQTGEMKFSNNGVLLSWDPNANPIVVERNVKLVQQAAFSSPDPFRFATTIQYAGNDATVSVYDISGVRIRTLSGKNGCAIWNGRDSFGQDAASGVYVYRLELGGKQITRTMNLAR